MIFLRNLSVFLFLVSNLLVSQNKQLLYDFTEIPQSLMVNPGMETSFKWYGGVPLLSGVSGYVGSNGVSVNDIFADDGLDINDKVRDRMVRGLSTKDEFSGNLQLELFNIGYRSSDPNVFYSFGAYLEMDNISYWPQDYAVLLFEGNADQLNRRFDLSDLKARGSMVNVFHIGVNKRVSNDLTIGARGKLYSGIFDYTSTNNKGYLVNTEGSNNTFTTTLSSDMKLKTSGVRELNTAQEDDELVNAIMKRAFFGGDLGLGLDLGFSYNLNETTVISGSLLDVGFIYHSGDVVSYSLKGTASTEGIEINVLEDFADLNRDYWQDLVDEVEELVPFKKYGTGYITFRPTKLNMAIRKDFGESIGGPSNDCDCDPLKGTSASLRSRYRNSAGAHLYMINRPRGPQMALTGFYTRRIGNILALKGTYTVDKFTYTNVGLGLNVQAGPVNIYAMADNLFSYGNIAASNYASFQLGLNIISWGRK
ncbi:hypothetical protein J8L85_06585 [Maribacter sp. MMG018]|uniref:DUF5723 family protein n=1 Tax=Maribacter sp. MMG018 TaxID=2822688 RepID=UPI001B36A3F8|nr:DUF5723 family protein [Maribacter sp. MMG018]MBQ4914094.1 hypothetical protein [Maribacter sp. MMG018]